MSILAPKHIYPFCTDEFTEMEFAVFKKNFADSFCGVYQIKCECGNTEFCVTFDEHPSCWIKCVKCNKNITVYDLKFYPSAMKSKEFFPKKSLLMGDNTIFSICVMYEYGDFYESYDDISWCNVWCKNLKTLEVVNLINDETS